MVNVRDVSGDHRLWLKSSIVSHRHICLMTAVAFHCSLIDIHLWPVVSTETTRVDAAAVVIVYTVLCLVWVVQRSRVVVDPLYVRIMSPQVLCFRLPRQLHASLQMPPNDYQHRSQSRATFVSTSRPSMTGRLWWGACHPRWDVLCTHRHRSM